MNQEKARRRVLQAMPQALAVRVRLRRRLLWMVRSGPGEHFCLGCYQRTEGEAWRAAALDLDCMAEVGPPAGED